MDGGTIAAAGKVIEPKNNICHWLPRIGNYLYRQKAKICARFCRYVIPLSTIRSPLSEYKPILCPKLIAPIHLEHFNGELR